jgi:hypothetical protein
MTCCSRSTLTRASPCCTSDTLQLPPAATADEDGCAAAGAEATCTAQLLVCRDVPAPGTGFKCVCPVGTGWYLSGCDVCVKVVAGYNLNGDGLDYGDNVLATEAKIPHPKDVSVDNAGNIYIAGGGIHQGSQARRRVEI